MKPLNAKNLSEGLLALNILATEEAAIQAIMQYSNILLKWNQIYNLISQKDTQHFLGRHLLDSCSLLPYLKGQQIL